MIFSFLLNRIFTLCLFRKTKNTPQPKVGQDIAYILEPFCPSLRLFSKSTEKINGVFSGVCPVHSIEALKVSH